jgi:hypothetical protein
MASKPVVTPLQAQLVLIDEFLFTNFHLLVAELTKWDQESISDAKRSEYETYQHECRIAAEVILVDADKAVN